MKNNELILLDFFVMNQLYGLNIDTYDECAQ